MRFRTLLEVWPIIAFVLAITVAGAQATTTLSNQGQRLDKLDSVPERLARIEEAQKLELQLLNKIDQNQRDEDR